MHCTHSYTQPHNLYQWEYLHEEKSALKVARSLLSLYSWLVGCIKIVMRICRQANHHAVAYWRLLAVVVVLWDYEHCTVNAVSASASDCGLLMVKCPEAAISVLLPQACLGSDAGCSRDAELRCSDAIQ